MKILYLHNEPFNSKMANLIQVKSMCKAMSQEGHTVTLSIPCDEKITDTKNVGYTLHFRKRIIKNKFDKYINFIPLIRIIKKDNPDMIYVRDPLILFYVLWFSKKNAIFESHNFILHDGYKLLAKFYRHLLKRAIFKGRVIKLVSISQALSNFWEQQGIPKYKLLAAHDGIDLEMFSRGLTREQARKKLSLPLNKTIVTYAGRLYANRKIDNILTLAEKFSDIHFLIVGGPSENAQYFKQEADRLNLANIQFTGQVKHEEIPCYLTASDILLALWSSQVSTMNYCSPLKLFEYMAANKIILAHGFPTIKEVLQDKTDAILVEPDNISDLIDKLNEALHYPEKERLAQNAYTKVKNEYTWQKRVQLIFVDL